MAKNGVLSAKQQRAVAAMLGARTIDQAATAANVGKRTLVRWLAQPDFRQALRDAETAMVDQAARELLSGQARALAALADLIDQAQSESVRRAAAVGWLDLTYRVRDQQEIERRLSELEQLVNKQEADK